MEPEDSLKIVYTSLLGTDSIPQQLRAGQGLEQRRFDRLVEALHLLLSYYAEHEHVPKRLALCMVDIYGSFSFREGFYSDVEASKIEDAGILLQELATDLFN